MLRKAPAPLPGSLADPSRSASADSRHCVAAAAGLAIEP
jgi:hypothetical protein